MSPTPQTIGDATVVCYTPIDARHRATEKTRHIVGGEAQPAMAGLAIAQYPQDAGFYLFYCDPTWNPATDTWHSSIEDAKRQAEFEYEGTAQTWINVPAPSRKKAPNQPPQPTPLTRRG